MATKSTKTGTKTSTRRSKKTDSSTRKRPSTRKKSTDTSRKKSGSRFFDPQIGNFVEGLMDVSTSVLKYAGGATGGIGKQIMKTPERLQLMGEAGKALKDMRETAGLTIEDLGSAIDLDDPSIIKAVEEGKVALPIDIMVRLASYYSRNDPVPFIMRFSRTYHPMLSELLNKTGVDRLMIKAEREMKFIKIYRNVDAARELSDEGFDRVLEFTRQAFLMAMHFVAEQEDVEFDESHYEKGDENSEEDF